MKINSIKIENYKSIKSLEQLSLKNLNILVGSNGAGKSNFISFFSAINKIIEKQLKPYSIEQGIDKLLYFGIKQSNHLLGEIDFGENKYRFKLKAANEGFLFIDEEEIYFNTWHLIGRATEETSLFDSDISNNLIIDALK